MIRKHLSRANRESIYFLTLHKCASTLFSDFILKNIIGLRHIDYAQQAYNGKISLSGDYPLKFLPRGRVYGPIRVSGLGSGDAIDAILFSPRIDPDFVKDKICVFFVRDPRDILVSAYHSFGFTHGFSPVPEVRLRQEKNRDKIAAMTLDQYAVDGAAQQVEHFETIDTLARACPRSVILRYEDMIDDFDRFALQLQHHVPLDPFVISQIYKRSRPSDQEKQASHRRSGRTGGFRRKLQPATIEALNERLAGILQVFNYPL